MVTHIQEDIKMWLMMVFLNHCPQYLPKPFSHTLVAVCIHLKLTLSWASPKECQTTCSVTEVLLMLTAL